MAIFIPMAILTPILEPPRAGFTYQAGWLLSSITPKKGFKGLILQQRFKEQLSTTPTKDISTADASNLHIVMNYSRTTLKDNMNS